MSDKTKEELKKERKIENVKKFKDNPRTKWVASNLLKVFSITNLTLLATLIVSILFQLDLFMLILLLGSVIFILMIIFKDLTDDKTKARLPFHFKIGLMLLVSNLVVYFIVSGLKTILPQQPLIIASLIVSVIVSIMMLALFTKDKFKETIENMMEKNVFDDLIGEEIKDGDAILGVDLETGKPVVLPYADRFLHMLALG